MRLPSFGYLGGIVILLLLFPTFLFFHAVWRADRVHRQIAMTR